jgi:hypothetical protein
MRVIPFALVLLAATAVASLIALRGHERHVQVAPEPLPVSDVEPSGGGLVVQPGSQTSLGAFRLRSGRSVHLARAQTVDGKSCLLEATDGEGSGSVCGDGSLFAHRKIAFAIESEGNPDALSELRVVGVVAPEIHAAEVLKSDGSGSDLELAKDGAFAYESPAAELARGVYPSGFKLYGASGKLVQALQFPARQ